MRAGCRQVVIGTGQTTNPILMVIAEAPGSEEDEQGEPFVGRAGQLLRDVLRRTGVISRKNTLLSNTLKCRPPNNKFPKDDSATICLSKWLLKEIELAKPQRMLLLGGKALEYVAGMSGITSVRGNWYDVRGIRTMSTYHPSYVLRKEAERDISCMEAFEEDIGDVADEVRALESKMLREQA
jgi:DNA polymerase